MAKKRDIKEIDVVSSELEALQKQSAAYASSDKTRDRDKKVVVFLCISLAVLILGVFVGMVVYEMNRSPVSYGPNVKPEEMTAEITSRHESRLEVFNEKGDSLVGVNFVGYNARFNEDGDLVVDGYIRNFTGHEVYNITGNITIETANDENVGGAYFEFLEEDFGSLKNGFSRPWRIVFDNDYVNVEITDLSQFTVTTEFKYQQK